MRTETFFPPWIGVIRLESYLAFLKSIVLVLALLAHVSFKGNTFVPHILVITHIQTHSERNFEIGEFSPLNL
jgi:hypothetical protein